MSWFSVFSHQLRVSVNKKPKCSDNDLGWENYFLICNSSSTTAQGLSAKRVFFYYLPPKLPQIFFNTEILTRRLKKKLYAKSPFMRHNFWTVEIWLEFFYITKKILISKIFLFTFQFQETLLPGLMYHPRRHFPSPIEDIPLNADLIQ